MGICEHNRRRSRCKECSGSGICEHNRERRQCKQCKFKKQKQEDLLQDIDNERVAALATEACLHARHAVRPFVPAVATEAKHGQFAASQRPSSDSLLRQQSGPPDAATELATVAKRGQPVTSSLQQAATETKHGHAASNELREQLKSRLLNRMKIARHNKVRVVSEILDRAYDLKAQ